MIDRLLAKLAPHHCYGCGKIGSLLCDNCKYDIVSEPYMQCVLCGKLGGERGVCGQCGVDCTRAWCVGERHDALKQLVDGLKFERVYDAHTVLADLLVDRLPLLPDDLVIVPIPTIAHHIRQRGYDHAQLIARQVARQIDRPLKPLLYRKTISMQRGAGKRLREQQASQAFGARAADSTSCYLLIDDVVTTGATLRHAARALKAAGASMVWVAVTSRQPLD